MEFYMKLTKLFYLVLLTASLIGVKGLQAQTASHFADEGYHCYDLGSGTDASEIIMLLKSATITINGVDKTGMTTDDYEIAFVYTYQANNNSQKANACTNKRNYLNFTGGNIPITVWGDGSLPANEIDGYTANQEYKAHIYDVANDKVYTSVEVTFNGGSTYFAGGFQKEITAITVHGDATPVYPADNAVQIPTSFDLEWTKTANCDAYEVVIATDDAFTSVVKSETINDANTTTLAVAGLSNNTKYLWRVRAKIGAEYTEWQKVEFLTALPTPELTNPADGYTGVPVTNAKIVFTTVTGADEYVVTIKDDEDNVVHTANDVVASPYTVPVTLGYCGEYSVTVQAKGIFSGTTNYSAVTEANNFMTVPDAVALDMPAADADVVSITPTFSWNTTEFANCATVATLEIIDMEDAPVFSTDVTFDSENKMEYTLKAEEALNYYTTYKWRVVAKSADAEGKATNWRILETEMNCAANRMPAADAIQVSLSPEFSWDAVTGAASYTVTLSANEDLSNPIFAENTTETTYAYEGTLDFETDYYWTVSPVNAKQEKECATFKFTSKMDTPTPGVPADMGTCAPVASLSGFQWAEFDGASSYEVEYKLESQDWDDATYMTGITVLNLPYSGLQRDAKYQWRIQAVKAGVETGWSAPNTFYTVVEPIALTTPVNGEFGITADAAVFTWEAVNQRGEDVPTYTIELADNMEFTDAMSFTTTATTYSVDGLTDGTKYFWRVMSTECGSDIADECNVWTVTVLPAAPALASPANNAVEVSPWAAYEVEDTKGAEGYQFMADDNNDFSSPVTEEHTLSTSLDFVGLESATKYFWKARGYQTTVAGTKVYGDWSEVRNFTTKELSAPQIAHPIDNAENVLLNILLEWNEVPNANYYGLQVATDADFENKIVDEEIVYHEYYELSNLEYGQTYFWRLNTVVNNGVDKSAWSKGYKFTIIPEIALDGSKVICAQKSYWEKTYVADFIPSVKYTWAVTNGTVVADEDEFDNTITIKWDDPAETGVAELAGVISLTRTADHWMSFSDSKDIAIEVNNHTTIDAEVKTSTVYTGSYCVNERIQCTATLNEIEESDLAEYWWEFTDGDNTVRKAELNTFYAWEEIGTYTAKFFAVTTEGLCQEYTEEFEIEVVNTCDVTMGIDNGTGDVCKGADLHQFELYVFGGDGGNPEEDYTFSWSPAYKFVDSKVKNATIKNETINRHITVYAWDRLNKMGSHQFQINILDKPLPVLKSILIVDNNFGDEFDLTKSTTEGGILQTYGTGYDESTWTVAWYDKNRAVIEEDDFETAALPAGINKFYLQVTNDKGCKSDLKRSIVYRRRYKGVANHELMAGANASAFLYAYPNPAIEYVHLFAEFENETNAKVSIVDINGRTVKTLAPEFGISIDRNITVSEFTAGTYFVIVETNDDTVMWKFIKQ
jgi:hypothetical protein